MQIDRPLQPHILIWSTQSIITGEGGRDDAFLFLTFSSIASLHGMQCNANYQAPFIAIVLPCLIS
ncbi:hypothetical protein TSUD_202190 [Trifolium subterraneum]|uniref:Uncharacterized protein n=1 Tax=Trifolium subterraneum TaxID=3900 RepID=A0A2Z6M0A5_TRISU|nr:hypothetical protein TSUD_202190 [Trifolium subterraneum]